ncbi:MAG TPA: response regulator, partial [Chroococcales cyanobacterium]
MGAKTILLADEDQQLILMLRSMLEGRGYSVMHSGTGRETLELVQKSVPDMVIIGEQIGDIDGISLILKLRKANGGLKMCFVSSIWRDAELYQQLTKDCRVALVVHRPLKPALFAAQIDSQFADTGMRIASSSDQEEKTFLALRARFTEVLPMRLSTIVDAIEIARQNAHDPSFAKEARRLAHNLKGTSSSCGFDLVGEAAAHLERALTDIQTNGQIADPAAWEEIELLFNGVEVQAATELKRNAPTAAQIEKLVDDS